MATARQTFSFLIKGTSDPELPRVFLDTTYDPAYDRPADRFAGSNLQQGLDNAQPGEILEVDAGALPGSVTLPLN